MNIIFVLSHHAEHLFNSEIHGAIIAATVTARSSAVGVTSDRTAYDILYRYRPLTGIAVVSISIYLFLVSN